MLGKTGIIAGARRRAKANALNGIGRAAKRPRQDAEGGLLGERTMREPSNARKRSKAGSAQTCHSGESRLCEGRMSKQNAEGGPKGERQDGTSNPASLIWVPQPLGPGFRRDDRNEACVAREEPRSTPCA